MFRRAKRARIYCRRVLSDAVVPDSTRPRSPAVLELVTKLQRACKTGDSCIPSADDSTRRKVVTLAYELLNAVEKPEDVVMRYAFESGAHRMAIRLGIDLRLFHHLIEAQCPVTVERLAKASSAEPLLIERIMRVNSSIGFVTEVDVRTYKANCTTKAITDPALEATMVFCHEASAYTEMKMHDYLLQFGYKCPDNSKEGPFQWLRETDLPFFDYVAADPKLIKNFHVMMQGMRSTRRHWTEWYPVRERLLEGASSEGDLIIDLGAGHGHDLEQFLREFPESRSRLVLQDLPKAVASIKGLGHGISIMAHDFMSPQPCPGLANEYPTIGLFKLMTNVLPGARVYFTHFVMHNWPDSDGRKILRNIAGAMMPGYSKILLNETVLPDRDCPSFFASGDINMMTNFGGIMRTERQWRQLINGTGLRLIKIWRSPFDGDAEGIIELTLDEKA